jgi:hypothetical protein
VPTPRYAGPIVIIPKSRPGTRAMRASRQREMLAGIRPLLPGPVSRERGHRAPAGQPPGGGGLLAPPAGQASQRPGASYHAWASSHWAPPRAPGRPEFFRAPLPKTPRRSATLPPLPYPRGPLGSDGRPRSRAAAYFSRSVRARASRTALTRPRRSLGHLRRSRSARWAIV